MPVTSPAVYDFYYLRIQGLLVCFRKGTTICYTIIKEVLGKRSSRSHSISNAEKDFAISQEKTGTCNWVLWKIQHAIWRSRYNLMGTVSATAQLGLHQVAHWLNRKRRDRTKPVSHKLALHWVFANNLLFFSTDVPTPNFSTSVSLSSAVSGFP